MSVTHVMVLHVGIPELVCSQVLHTILLGSLLLRNSLPPILRGLSRVPNSGTLPPRHWLLLGHSMLSCSRSMLTHISPLSGGSSPHLQSCSRF